MSDYIIGGTDYDSVDKPKRGGLRCGSNGVRARGLSFKNKVTGEIVMTTSRELRIRRLKRRVRAWIELMELVRRDKGCRMVMVTLTYRGIDDWRANHIRDFMIEYRKAIRGKLYGYSWVAELQQRGAVHYHLLLVVSKGARIPRPDEYWVHGMTRIETARTPFYLMTYAGKEAQKLGDYPKGIRAFSVWVDRDSVGDRLYYSFRLSVLPGWLREIVGSVGEGWPEKVKGGWMFMGVLMVSPFVFLGITA